MNRRGVGSFEPNFTNNPHTEHLSLALMMRAIIDNQMTVEYEQIILTSSGETILESELMISAWLFSCRL